ncbi:hypothetical protein IC620_12825 [Hazenella sp. IB182357]|uniref:DPH-type MB domain-containing protein n=1 Tax=Polycladospora coralii TaxID=2771432 RepID=A0A926RV02_9BACL|nr:CD1247 N-terminal domain-containing protein [Polycladospora coralii]MBD1373232.1 hypothetical protein [Polycladospora coralii]MBS7530890.1 hypothetical protein [Polycladospora coralii]
MFEELRRELSYVRGLLEGQSNDRSVDSKVVHRLIDVLDEVILSAKQTTLRQDELEEYVEAIDEDLNDVELLIYDDELDDGLDFVCPECGEDVSIDFDDMEDDSIELLCPKCHTVLKIEDVSNALDEDNVLEAEDEVIM